MCILKVEDSQGGRVGKVQFELCLLSKCPFFLLVRHDDLQLISPLQGSSEGRCRLHDRLLTIARCGKFTGNDYADAPDNKDFSFL